MNEPLATAAWQLKATTTTTTAIATAKETAISERNHRTIMLDSAAQNVVVANFLLDQSFVPQNPAKKAAVCSKLPC